MAKGLDIHLILHAAAEIADQETFEHVTLAALAKKLGVKTPSLYNHIEGLPDLRKRMALYGIERMKRVMTEASVGKSGDEAVMSLGLAYVSFVRSHPGLYEATMTADFSDEDLQQAGQEVVHLILLVLQHYDLTSNQAIHAVRGLRSLVHGFASIEMRKGFGMDLDRDESLKEILSTFIRGLNGKK